ncbi:MAG: hypothetical protein M1374_05370 [Firmicutes bacterium]|nr:hypothetical protein [Bacillota bacterium]
MGLMDKVKLQAGQLADKAQEAGKAGQAKLEALQAKKRVQSVLMEIGTITYQAQEGNSASGDEQRLEELYQAVKDYEDSYGKINSKNFEEDNS